MTTIGNIIAFALSTGIPPEKLQALADLCEQYARDQVEFHRNSGGNPVETAHDRRKKWDRERKRNSGGNSLSVYKEESFLIEDSEKKEEKVVARARGTRLPGEWAPDADGSIMAAQMLGQDRYLAELAKFTDYWRAQPGQRGVKLDWNATWRNWIRNAGVPRANGPTLPFNGQAAAAGGFDSSAYLARREKRIAEQMALREQVERERGAAP